MSTKQKLLVVAGAGSAIEFGMPSVDGVHKILLQEANHDLPLDSDPAKNLRSIYRSL